MYINFYVVVTFRWLLVRITASSLTPPDQQTAVNSARSTSSYCLILGNKSQEPVNPL